jgi:hypothetical protein
MKKGEKMEQLRNYFKLFVRLHGVFCVVKIVALPFSDY